jgi:hypothetical protein
MNNFLKIAFFTILFSAGISAQTIAVNPTGVNVNSQNATTVFLTFGVIPPGYVPAEAIWCGELIPAPAPAIGLQCRPDTIYGALPARFNLSTPSGNGGFTDIMSIPPSVVRRAYQAAVRGANAGFFYVRRFISVNGDPDQYVNVTCRMTGGGARVPFALINVELKTPSGDPVLFIKSGEKFPEIVADIQYNGTGRLKGRWEIVQPGEEPPADEDLLTEATLPVEKRGSQRRYTQISRFNEFLQPTGKFKLPLEANERLKTLVAGQYILLLRIEATDDKESDSNLAAVGVGNGVVHSGAVASFPMPTLKFFVVGESATTKWADTSLVLPQKNVVIDVNNPLVFTWREFSEAKAYRLEVLDDAGSVILSAITLSPITSYRAPSWFWTRFANKKLSWRVAALDESGAVISQTGTQALSTN